MFEKILSRFGYTKQLQESPQAEFKAIDILNDYFVAMGMGTGSALSGQKTFSQLVDAYKSWVYTAIDKKARTVATLPLKVYTFQRKSTGKCFRGSEIKMQLKGMQSTKEKRAWLKQNGIQQIEIDDHPFYDLLKKPNKIDTRFTLWYSIVAKLELNGFIGLYKNKLKNGMILELWPLPMTKYGDFRAVPDNKLVLAGYRYTDGDVNQIFTPDQIVPFRYPHPGSPFEGYSPILAQQYPYDLDLYLMQQQHNFLRNGARPGTVLSTEQKLTREQVAELKEQIDSMYKGVSNTGKPMVLHSGLKQDKPLQMSGTDLLLTDVVDFARDKLLTGYNTPPAKIGLGKYETRAALEAVNEAYIMEAIKPTIMLIEEAFEAFLLPDYDSRLTCDFELPQVQERAMDLQERQMNLTTGYHTINEERAINGEEPVEWGDKPWMPFSVSQVGSGSIGPNAAGSGAQVEDNGNGGTDDGDDIEEPTKALYSPDIKALSPAYWTKERRDIEWKEYAARTERWEQVFTGVMVDYFDAQLGEILEKLQAEGSKIKALVNGWSLQKVRGWLSEHKAKYSSININKKEAAKQLKEIAKPMLMMIMQDFGQKRIDQLSTVKAGSFQWNTNEPRVKKYLGNRLELFSQEVTGTTFNDIDAVLREGFGSGEPLAKIAETLREKFVSYEKYRAALISRTETISSSNFADIEGVKQMGLEDKVKKAWLSSRDGATRESHLAAESQYESGIDVDESFKVGADTMVAPGNGSDPAENINCFPGDAVCYAKNPKKLFRSKYNGKIITIETASGHKLTGTPNHPILTSRGFIALNLIKKGDSIISAVNSEWEAFCGLDVENRPTKFEEFFNFLSSDSVGVRAKRCEVNFYGDRPDGDVDIVNINGKLHNWGQAEVGAPIKHLDLSSSNVAPGDLLGSSLLDSEFPEKLGGLSSKSIIGLSGNPNSVIEAQPGHSNEHRIMPVSGCDASFSEPVTNHVSRNPEGLSNAHHRASRVKHIDNFSIINNSSCDTAGARSFNSSFVHDGINGRGCDSVFLADISNMASVNVVLDEVVVIHENSYSGDVFTMETDNGIYICNGVVVKNCRCSMFYITE